MFSAKYIDTFYLKLFCKHVFKLMVVYYHPAEVKLSSGGDLHGKHYD